MKAKLSLTSAQTREVTSTVGTLAKAQKLALKEEAANENRIAAPTGDWADALRMSEDGRVLSCPANALTILARDPQWAGVLRWDEFQSRLVFGESPPWSDDAAPLVPQMMGDAFGDSDEDRIVDYLDRHYGVVVQPGAAYRMAVVVGRRSSVHPVREYLDGLVWDGVPRIDTWMSTYLGVQLSEYSRRVAAWSLIQACKRIYEPGCKADYVPVLEGPQGLKKSTAIATLSPRREWTMDTPFEIGEKDSFMALRGIWLGEVAEMASILKSEPEAAKAFFSSGTDRFRPPYGRDMVDAPRHCTLWGTINVTDQYLRDETGARRYWPVLCSRIDLDALARDRDQLWAEAVARMKVGERCYPDTPEEHAIFEAEQQARQDEDAWQPLVEAALSRLNTCTVNFVLRALGKDPKDSRHSGDKNRVLRILRALGWTQRAERPTVEGVRHRVYDRVVTLSDADDFAPSKDGTENLLAAATLDQVCADLLSSV